LGNKLVIHRGLKYVRRLFFWLSTIAMSLLLLLFVLVQTSQVQNYIANFTIDKFNSLSSSKVSFGSVKINWLDNISIKELRITDYRDNILFAAKSMTIDFSVSQLLRKTEVTLDEVILDSANFNFTKYRDSLDINIVKFLYEIKKGIKKDGNIGDSRVLKVASIKILNSVFRYDNRQKKRLGDKRLDHSHITWQLSELNANNLQIINDSLIVDLRYFKGLDSLSKFEIMNLATKLTVFSKGVYFDSLLMYTNKSVVKHQFHLEFDKMSDFNSFSSAVYIDADLKDTQLNLEELNYFVSHEFPNVKTNITTKIKGRVDDFSLKDLNISMGKSSIEGSLSLNGLPKLQETFIELNLQKSTLYKDDFEDYISDTPFAISKLYISGSLVGFLHNFVSYAKIKTDFGELQMDLNLKIPTTLSEASYSGSLGCSDFFIGQLINKREYFGKVSLNGKISGAGLTMNNADLEIKTLVSAVDFNEYRYDYLFLNGRFRNKFFKGDIHLMDRSARLTGDILVDLNKDLEVIQSKISIENFDLQATNFTKSPLRLTSNFKLDTKGLVLDSLFGKLILTDVLLKSDVDSMNLELIKLDIMLDEHGKQVQLSLPELKLILSGKFSYKHLFEDFSMFVSSMKNRIVNDKHTPIQSGNIISPPYSADLTIEYEELAPYLKFFQLPFYFSDKGIVESHFDKRSGFNFNFYTQIDSLAYKDIRLSDVIIDANIAKGTNSKDILANVVIKSSNQNIYNIPKTEKLFLEATWYNQKLIFESKLTQPTTLSFLGLNGSISFLNDRAIMVFDKSSLIFCDEEWTLNPFNSISLNEGGVEFDRVEMYDGKENIAINGEYMYNSVKDITVELNKIDLKILNLFSTRKFVGKLTSLFNFHASIFDSLTFAMSSEVQGMSIDNVFIGDIVGVSNYVADSSYLDLKYDINRDAVDRIKLVGSYNLDDLKNPLALNLEFDSINIGFMNPFLDKAFSDIDGYANGVIEISGTLNEPVFKGKTEFKDSELRVDFLNVFYDFQGELLFDNDNILFHNFTIADKEGNEGVITGNITHSGFKETALSIDINAKKLLLLNTSRNENSSFYGTAFGTGTVKIVGPVNNLSIRSKATTEKGSKIFIPLSSNNVVSTKEYISFVDLSKNNGADNRINEIVNTNLGGITFDMDLTVTNDAYVELIFDIRTGDIIRGRANGNLNMTLDTDGQFDLFGGVTIEEGAYNFTIPNLINKEFNILPGSTITWYGDPYAGNLDLEATYRQVASLGDYFLNTVETDANNRIPFLVQLQLEGDMLSPNIGFNIDFDQNLSNVTIRDEEVISSLNENEQELKRQVFSLLILKKFSPQNTFAVGGDAFGSSVSEFLSNQFSYFLSQVDENLELDFDIGSLDQNALNTFQLRLSYTFLEGRLKVTGGGKTDANETSNQFLGDWSVRYALTEDGQLLIRAFSQNEQIIDEWQRETGLSLQFVKSFDDLKELLLKAQKKPKL